MNHFSLILFVSPCLCLTMRFFLSRLADDGLRYIQTNTTLNPGNSGGPLIDSQGELIGIVEWKVAGYEELGFAIPSNRAGDVIQDILG